MGEKVKFYKHMPWNNPTPEWIDPHGRALPSFPYSISSNTLEITVNSKSGGKYACYYLILEPFLYKHFLAFVELKVFCKYPSTYVTSKACHTPLNFLSLSIITLMLPK